MNQFVEYIRFSPVMKQVIVVFILILGVAIGPLVQILHVGVREIAIAIMIVLMAMLVLVPSERVLGLAFTLWVLTFAFGWRTIYLTTDLNVHPAEVLVFLLFFALIALSIVRHTRLDFSIPAILVVFAMFTLFGLFTALAGGTRWDYVVSEFKSFAEIIPVYYVTKWMIRTRESWERAARLTMIVAVYIGCLGLMDFFTPGLSQVLSGQPTIDPIFLSQNYSGASFSRVGFIFFGNFTAGFVIFTFIGFTVYHLLESLGKNAVKQVFLSALLLIQAIGIYLSGYRGLWYSVAVFLIVYVFLRGRAVILIVATLIGVTFLPPDFVTRFQSIFNPEFADSSQYDRIARANAALDVLYRSPFTGAGWAGSGYVHSDLVQIAANLGIFGILTFLIWISGIIYQLFKLTRSSGWASSYARVLLPSVCSLVVILAGEGLAHFVQLIMPVWFVFALCHRLPELESE